MAKFEGELKVLPITALHENENNIREDMDDLEFLAEQIKTFGVQVPLVVYPHPKIEGDFVVREGNRRYLASLKAQQQELPCIVKPATNRDEIADVDMAMTTGRTHKRLNESEVSHGIQRYFDLGQDLTTIGKKTKMSRKEVQARAKVAQKNDGVSKAYSAGRLTLDTVQRLQELEEQSADPKLYERVVEKIESMTNGASLETVERVIDETERAVARDRNREALKEMNAPEAPDNATWSAQFERIEDELSFEEHYASGHQWRIDYYASEPTWYVKKEAKEVMAPEPTAEEIAEQKHLDQLSTKLPIVRDGREKFAIARLNSKDLPEDPAKNIVIGRIIKNNRDDEELVLLGKIVSNAVPEQGEDQSEEEYLVEVDKWTANVRKFLGRLKLTQLVLIEGFLLESFGSNVFGNVEDYYRDSGEEERWYRGWNRYYPYYAFMMDSLGYELDQDEVEVMVHMARKAPDRVKEYDLVQVPTDECTATCQECSQEVVADSEWAGFCVNCIDDAAVSE